MSLRLILILLITTLVVTGCNRFHQRVISGAIDRYYETRSTKWPLLCSVAERRGYRASPKCYMGKACGNTCININYTCRKGRGSACNVTSYGVSYP